MSPIRIEKGETEVLYPKDSITREIEVEIREKESKIKIERRIQERRETVFVILAFFFPILIVFALVIIFLDGFGLWGFDIDTAILGTLVGSIIGQVVSLLILVIGGTYQSKKD